MRGNSSAGSVGIMKTLVEKKSSGAYAVCRSYFKDREWIKSRLVEILIAKGAKVNFNSKYGDTALMEAAGNGKKGDVKILLKHGADINAKDNLGRTALMKAWGEPDNVDMVELLLKAGADIDAVDLQGDTVLMYTVRAGRLNTVKLLLKWRAKADTKNVRGQTALDYAKIAEINESVKAKDIISALQQALAK